ncbi:cytochrome P450 [Panaeolus papilionaceus]|nr:cytochrome P450 [Panaeolus papilionaceus]
MTILDHATNISPLTGGGIALFVSYIVWRLSRKVLSNKSILHLLPGPKADSWLAGSLPQLVSPEGWDYNIYLGREYGRVMSVQSPFGNRLLYTSDPLAMHHIFVKDQDAYQEIEHLVLLNRVMFGEGILSTLGDQHRKQRRLLNPTFSVKHLRNLTPTIYSVGHRLERLFSAKTASGPQEIDLLAWMARAALEVIGQSGFGYSFEPLTEDGASHPFSGCVKNVIPLAMKPSILFTRLIFLPAILRSGIPWLWRTLTNLVPWKSLHELRDARALMYQTASEIYEEKKIILGGNTDSLEAGKDVLTTLMQENMKEAGQDAMSDEEVLAQVASITFAATETTSGALSRILHLLALHPSVQEKLRQEITSVRGGSNVLDYDTLTELPYLDAVCRETLRMYPPLIAVMRSVLQDTVLPLSKPVRTKNGQIVSEIPLSKGNEIFIPLINCNCDKTLWGPDAEEWKPERWLSPLPDELIEAKVPGIYSHSMSFIGGSRSCIGAKFAQLEIKIILSVLLEKFTLSPSIKEIKWQVAGMASPTVVGEGSRPQLPLLVAPITT